ncbi:polysaccharide deacetylase family protein [Paludicola sp. MB14-C6]|uniref:polysaccharide deacetylase family protein n=1 Tax=Paludihabitans sp. MB14-C6 TaxID=3070656 RepID=UPI0027DCE83B|nr:polysaccharide deacetylase family protein [Paludicola sp. MB14-C6]WMJ21832.1 polysaccharide deacetylase family protein [Paludicola sp. MB14-C6]
MIMKLNYNIIAVLLSIVFFISLCLLDVTIFTPAETKVDAKQDVVELPVAMYHQILKDYKRWGDYVIPPSQFEEDLKYIQQKGYTTVSAQQIMNYVNKGTPLPPKPMLITFDDGYEGVYEYAFPLLKKYNMKAVFAIIGKHTDIFSNPNEKQSVVYGHATWDQLREMQKSGVFEIGNHTYNMHDGPGNRRYGTKIRPGESIVDYKIALDKDVGALYKQIEKEIGVAPLVFAYPFGAICPESKPILKDIGFSIILTSEQKNNTLTRNMATPIYLKRFNRPHSDSTSSYFKKFNEVKK